jgi:hypothetical protein
MPLKQLRSRFVFVENGETETLCWKVAILETPRGGPERGVSMLPLPGRDGPGVELDEVDRVMFSPRSQRLLRGDESDEGDSQEEGERSPGGVEGQGERKASGELPLEGGAGSAGGSTPRTPPKGSTAGGTEENAEDGDDDEGEAATDRQAALGK